MVFPTGFNVIVSWLSPLFGTSLRIALSQIFVLLGDPFVYSTLFILWIARGLFGRVNTSKTNWKHSRNGLRLYQSI